jgi:hypothetical protein
MPATQPVKMFPPGPRELLKSTSALVLLFEDTSRSSDLVNKVTRHHRSDPTQRFSFGASKGGS